MKDIWMDHERIDLVIIGGGLTGLTLAYLLKDTDLDIRIIEARNRWGGRILTCRNEGGPPQEMGATWLGKKHTALNALLRELQLEIFEQTLSNKAIYEAISTSAPQLVQLPNNDDPSFRIANGTDTIISTLMDHLSEDQLWSSEKVISLRDEGNAIRVQTDKHVLKVKTVVSTLPPYLFSNTIDIDPVLNESLKSVLDSTHTWMGESIKVSLTYKTPFWRDTGLSGTIFSNVGPIPEMYDHSNIEDNSYALKGFFNGAYFSISKEERLALVLKQLRKYFGNKADDYIHYEERAWRNEPFTFAPYPAHVLPHQNNGHVSYRSVYWSGKLILGGAETAAQFPGYMEGAVRSANYIASLVRDNKQ